MTVNRTAQKYRVSYAVPAKDGQRKVHVRHFNCVTKAMKFASFYSSMLRIPAGEPSDHGQIWCGFHQVMEVRI